MSSECAAAGRAALCIAREVKANLPKCGAKAKSTGEPCKQVVPQIGMRCHFHGGSTPKGDDWHKSQLANSARSLTKLGKKLSDLEQRRRQQKDRVANMSPEERLRHERWQDTHQPGAKSERTRAKRDREAGELLSRQTSRPASPGVEALGDRLDELKARKELLIANLEAGREAGSKEDGKHDQ